MSAKKRVLSFGKYDADEVKPLDDRILVRRIPEETVSLIEIPDIAKQKSLKGIVLATGPGKRVEGVNGDIVRRPCDVKPGDVIAFGQLDDFEDGDTALIQEADIRFVYEVA